MMTTIFSSKVRVGKIQIDNDLEQYAYTTTLFSNEKEKRRSSNEMGLKTYVCTKNRYLRNEKTKMTTLLFETLVYLNILKTKL